jgi:hypothetical protein
MSKELDFEELRKCSNYVEKKIGEAIYMGEITHGKREGCGIMKYASGRVYEGEWKNDLRNGRGFEKYANGNTYMGNFKSGIGRSNV